MKWKKEEAKRKPDQMTKEELLAGQDTKIDGDSEGADDSVSESSPSAATAADDTKQSAPSQTGVVSGYQAVTSPLSKLSSSSSSPVSGQNVCDAQTTKLLLQKSYW